MVGFTCSACIFTSETNVIYAQTATQRTLAAGDGDTATEPPEGRMNINVTDKVSASLIEACISR